MLSLVTTGNSHIKWKVTYPRICGQYKLDLMLGGWGKRTQSMVDWERVWVWRNGVGDISKYSEQNSPRINLKRIGEMSESSNTIIKQMCLRNGSNGL